jgi:hypothetical protein
MDDVRVSLTLALTAPGEIGEFLKACVIMYLFDRNAYNRSGIEAELGAGCDIYLNIHGTRTAQTRLSTSMADRLQVRCHRHAGR